MAYFLYLASGNQNRVNQTITVSANLPYIQGKEGAAHFRLASPVDTLLRQLSEELPSYQQT